jgi:hypothetical protein
MALFEQSPVRVPGDCYPWMPKMREGEANYSVPCQIHVKGVPEAIYIRIQLPEQSHEFLGHRSYCSWRSRVTFLYSWVYGTTGLMHGHFEMGTITSKSASGWARHSRLTLPSYYRISTHRLHHSVPEKNATDSFPYIYIRAVAGIRNHDPLVESPTSWAVPAESALFLAEKEECNFQCLSACC